MNFDQLKIFLTVVENKSFTKAAEALYISHSTTSRNVASLEEYLGVPLLARDNRTIRLTPAGEELYRDGTKLMQRIDAIEANVRSTGKGSAGKLSVMSVDLYSYALSNCCRNFCRRYPDILLCIHHRDSSEIFSLIKSGEGDMGFAFSFAFSEDTTGIEVRKISSESFCVIAPIDHEFAMHSSVTIADILSSNYIALSGFDFGFIKDPDIQSRLSAKAADSIAVPTVESLFLQVRSGNGISIVPYPVAYEHGNDCAILEICDADTAFDIDIIWRSDNPNPTLRSFMDIVDENIGPKK